jgi:glycosyltransferase involved in cell wall biosynthesis
MLSHPASGGEHSMRILKLVLGVHPTSRPDIAVLFGRYLPRLGIHTDLVAQAADNTLAPVGNWGGGRVLLCRRTGKRSTDQILAFIHDMKVLWALQPDRYDAVQIRDKVFAAVFAIWVARRRRVPVFYWMSFPMSEVYIEMARKGGLSIGVARWLFLMSKGYIGRTLIYRYVLPRCTHVFVQSERMLEDLSARGISRAAMTPVLMGVDLERSFPRRPNALRHDSLQGRRVVAYLGSFEHFRRLDFLLEVMQQLALKVPDAVLLMIGDSNEPEDRAQLERHAEALGIAERVVWTGWVSSIDAWRWLANADVAISIVPRGPLYDCASPTKVVEYLALGIPVVATDQPDQKKILEESGAGICVEMDRAAFLLAIEQILSTPSMGDRMRAAGPPYVAANRGYDRIAARVAETYRRYAAERQ